MTRSLARFPGVLCAGLLLVLSQGTIAVAQTKEGDMLWSGDFSGDWMKKWHVRDRHWGLKNVEVVQDPDGKHGACLRVTYPEGSASPTVTKTSKAPVGGAQFYADLNMAPRESLHLRYYVRFAEGFDFVKGGKLPGLFGGEVGSGGHIPDGTNGLSTRCMWRTGGDGEVYAYLPTSKEHGTSLGRGNWTFKPGQWYLVEQEVNLNTPGKEDGSIKVWIGEKPVLHETNLLFRTIESLKIEGILFSTFFGGHDKTWATPRTTHADFADFAVSKSYIGPAR
jgi:hypothetical protein